MSAQTNEHTWTEGDLFTVDPALYPMSCHGVVYRVTQRPHGARGVNYVGKPVAFNSETRAWDDTQGRGVKATADVMTLVTPDTEPAPYSGGTRVVETVPFAATPDVGALVRIGHKPGGAATPPRLTPGLYVVTGHPSRKPGVRLVALGGASGRYWPSIPAAWCEVIDPARVHIDGA